MDKADSTSFRGHPKTKEDKWHEAFRIDTAALRQEQAAALVALLNKIVIKYLQECVPTIFYDAFVEKSDILQAFFQARTF